VQGVYGPEAGRHLRVTTKASDRERPNIAKGALNFIGHAVALEQQLGETGGSIPASLAPE